MSNTNTAWLDVWSSATAQGQYAFPGGRLERALDKLNHFDQIGITFKPGERVLEAGCGDGSIIINLIRKYQLDRIIKQAVGKWPMGYQTEFSPRKLFDLLIESGFCNVQMKSILRPPLPHDDWARKTVSRVDRFFYRALPSWGFYSYAWGSKKEKV